MAARKRNPNPARRRTLHPVIPWAEGEGLEDLRSIASRLGVNYQVLKGMVTGHRGISFKRAEAISRKTDGAIGPLDLLRWHAQNRRPRPNRAA